MTLVPSGAQNTKALSVCQDERQRLQMATGDAPAGRPRARLASWVEGSSPGDETVSGPGGTHAEVSATVQVVQRDCIRRHRCGLTSPHTFILKVAVQWRTERAIETLVVSNVRSRYEGLAPTRS